MESLLYRYRLVSIIDIFLIIGSLLLLNGYLLESIVLIGFFGGSMISQYMSLIGEFSNTGMTDQNFRRGIENARKVLEN